MNFFEHQAKARKQSRWIIIGFILVALLIIFVINALVYFMLGSQGMLAGQYSNVQAQLFSTDMLSANSELLLTTSGIVGGLIGLSSLGKIVSLRSGGGKVARDMGATIVTPDTKDSLRRRLYNVVEEIALASGVPVPEVYVMENEPGINAFAAGYSPADAAIAVTQGTLEKLDRAELQGVVAHEFSHIFNGDMRINIKMMGVIFGIMVIAILGRKFMSASRYRMSSSRNNNGNAIVFVGLGLMVVGYIGLFFARWMKSALSRQREYLADASAVQFTRDPSSIAGALKKIAAFNHSSYLTTENEEVSHMLFGSGAKSLMFATHPPLVDRIQRLERGFKESDIADLSVKLKKQEQREHVQAEKAQEEQKKRSDKKLKGGMFDVDSIISNIGNPATERIAAAAVLADSLSDGLSSAAHSLEWAPEVLFYCLLDSDPELIEQQKLIVTKFMGDISEKKLNILLKDNGLIKPEQRLALFDICFPTLKRRPVHEIEKILYTIEQMSVVDNKIDPFEFLLSSLVSKYLHEAHIPNKTRLHGNKKISSCIEEITLVISTIATHGQVGGKTTEGLQKAQKAFRSGMESLGIKHKNLTFNNDWHKKMTEALETLNKLSPSEKQKVISALAKTVLDDDELITQEQEMLRVVSALINVPLPILQTVK